MGGCVWFVLVELIGGGFGVSNCNWLEGGWYWLWKELKGKVWEFIVGMLWNGGYM